MKKVFLVVLGLVLTGVCVGQSITVNLEKSFEERVSDYYRDCNLHESTIFKLFENQIWLDTGDDMNFEAGELMMIINRVLVLPVTWQDSILNVIKNPENYDYQGGNFSKN